MESPKEAQASEKKNGERIGRRKNDNPLALSWEFNKFNGISYRGKGDGGCGWERSSLSILP